MSKLCISFAPKGIISSSFRHILAEATCPLHSSCVPDVLVVELVTLAVAVLEVLVMLLDEVRLAVELVLVALARLRLFGF